MATFVLSPAREPKAHAHYLQWCWFGEATLARPLGEIVNHSREFPDDKAIPEVVAEMQNRVALSLNAVAEATHDCRWLVGNDFSAADIMVGYSVFLASRLTPDAMPEAILPYWQALQARPAYQRTMAV